MLRRSLPILVVVALAGAVARGADPTGQEGGSGQPTFRSGVDLVRMDVRVSDGTGRPITDLDPGELEIYEDGKRLPVVLFQRVTEPADTYVEDAIRATTAEVSSNSAFPRGHLYILIFDQEHITPGNEQRARRAAEEFIRRRVRPADRVALFAIPGPGPQLGFTANKLRAIEALDAIRGSYQRTPPGAYNIPKYDAHLITQGSEKAVVDTLERLTRDPGSDLFAGLAEGRTGRGGGAGAADDVAVQRRLILENARTIVNQSDAESRQFLQRLADVIAGFREIEGRKSVVLFSEGFFQDNLSRELETVAAAAAQSYCVFYTMDLNSRSQRLDEAYVSDTSLSSEVQARIAPLSTLAVETDGAMFVDAASRTDAVLNALADQAGDYYLVGFTPSEDARMNRGKYRRVQVRVKRDGARVSARTGYAVAPEGSALTDRRASIEQLLGAPFVQQGLKLDYTTYVLKDRESGLQRVVLSLNTDLPVRAKPGDSADVVFVVRDVRNGQVMASGNDLIPLPASVEGRSPLGRGAWRVHFNLPPGSYMMRTVVREPGGLSGSADRRLEVKALDGPDVNVSDFVVGSAIGGLPVRAQVYSGSGLTGAIETYGRAQSALENLRVVVELKRDQDAAPVKTMTAELHALEHTAAGVSRRASVFMPIDDVPAGPYVAHAIVRAGGEIVGERTRQIDVLAGAAPAPQASAAAAGGNTWTPMEIVRGDLARRYVAALAARAKGTPAAPAAAHALANRWEQVEAETGRSADTSPATAALRGLALFVREDYRGAGAALKAARDAGPDDALTAFFMGWALEGAGDRPGAVGAWRSAAHLDPSMVSAHLALADGYLRMGQPALAVQALKAGLQAMPASPELLAKLQQIEGR